LDGIPTQQFPSQLGPMPRSGLKDPGGAQQVTQDLHPPHESQIEFKMNTNLVSLSP
jgi:hypothetical protein